jgi:DNA-binding PadR family transcriptional regulator
MRITGMASGSLYPLLARLEGAGWLTMGKESIDPRAAGRPPRMHYTITWPSMPVTR